MEEKENITHPVNVFVLPLSNEITIKKKKAVQSQNDFFLFTGEEKLKIKL